MIIEFPQADLCCFKLSLRSGVIIIAVLRSILILLVILFGTRILTIDDEKRELVLTTVTVVLIMLWLFLIIPGVIWEVLTVILIASLMEIVIWCWLFFLSSYQFAISIFNEHISFLLVIAWVCLMLEYYVLWIMWSYYVEVKDWVREHSLEGARYRRRSSSSSSSPI